MFKLVTRSDLMQAAAIHAESWKASHRDLCSAEFIAIHTPERQRGYLESEIAKGAQLYMLIDTKPVGIVSNKGYGTRLLSFAVQQCKGTPRLWVLSTNTGARRLYGRHGFEPTGSIVQHTHAVYELELRLHLA